MKLPPQKPLNLNRNCFNVCDIFCSWDRDEQSTHSLFASPEGTSANYSF